MQAEEPPALKISVERVSKRPATALAGVPFRVSGTLTPYVAGQKVTVRLYRGGRKVRAQAVTVQPGGGFRLRMTSRRSGRVTVRASHRATPQLATAKAAPVRVRVVRPSAAPGSRGPSVRFLQRALWRRGYAVSRSGTFDSSTSRAVLAFRKLTRRARVPRADRAVFRGLLGREGYFQVRYPKHGKHVEGDLTHQVMALIEPGGKVRRIYNISSGKASTPTILGRFRVYRKDFGTNSHGMVHSAYFQGGYAIHGYASVPTFPASHGCLRVPVPQALDIFRWIDLGDRVDVYYRGR